MINDISALITSGVPISHKTELKAMPKPHVVNE
jgi:hypothetical protein